MAMRGLLVPLALFDLDNTLLDREAAFARWAGAFVVRLGLAATPVPLGKLPEDPVVFLVEADRDGFAPRDEVFEALKSRYSLDVDVADLVEEYRESYPHAFELSGAARSGLRALRSGGWKVGVVTNGLKFQEAKLIATGLIDEIDACCVSGTVDSWKPDPFIFEEAARRCGVGLDGWMVGDSPEADIRGGQGVGLKTIWLQRGRAWTLDPPLPDAQVGTVEAAIDLILRTS
jgi:FMN phosphatase YigB (HAD superfamily)